MITLLTDGVFSVFSKRKNYQTGDLQVGLSRFERGIKSGVEVSVSPVTLEADEVQPSSNGVTDSEDDDDCDGEAINNINNKKLGIIVSGAYKRREAAQRSVKLMVLTVVEYRNPTIP